MICLDTSVLCVLHLPEPSEERIARAIGEEDAVVASELTRVEFRSVVARHRRAGSLSADDAAEILLRFADAWQTMEHVAVDDDVLDRAAALVESQPLRTLDAIQLASALRIGESPPEPLRFAALDRRLAEAARREGLALLLS